MISLISFPPKCVSFADGCVLYRPIASPDDPVLLQNDLSAIMNWCSDWQMSHNYSKCKLLRFTRKRSVSSCIYSLGTQPIEDVPSYKYTLMYTPYLRFILGRSHRIHFTRRIKNFGIHPTLPRLCSSESSFF